MGHRYISDDVMAFYLAEYEAKYGKMIFEDFTKYRYNSIWFGLPMILFTTILMGSMFTFVDFSHHRVLSKMSQLLMKGLGLFFFAYGSYAIWKLRRFFTPHGACLFEKGILFRGYWGFDGDDDFLSINEMERILAAPSRETAGRLHMGRMTAGFGQPIGDGYTDWAYSPGEIENLVRFSLGKILIVHKQRFYDYDFSCIKISEIVDAPRVISGIRDIAVRNDIAFIRNDFVPDKKEDLEPIKYKNIGDCEKEYGKIIYPGFTKMPAHLFEGGIVRWADWPIEPGELNFVNFRNIETILVQPSKNTAMKYLEPVDRLFYDFAPADRKEACKPDRMKLESEALKLENCILMIYKSKRAETIREDIKDIKDPKKFKALLKDLGKRYGFEVIDESHLPSGTGEKIRPN